MWDKPGGLSLKKFAVILVVALILIATGLALHRPTERTLTTASDEAYSLYLEGNQRLVSFQFIEAVDALERALELDPEFAMAAAALMECYGWQGRMSERDSIWVVADSLTRSIEDDIERMKVQLRLHGGFAADVDRRAGRDSVMVELQKVAPDDLIVLAALAAKAKGKKDSDEAERIWRQVLDRDSNYAAAYNELGYIYFFRGDYDEALELLQRYAFLAPDIANPHDSLGEVLFHMGRYEEAEKELTQAIRLQPDFVHPWIFLARTYIAQGRVNKGVDLLAQVSTQVTGTSFEREVKQLAVTVYYAHENWDRLDPATAEYIVDYPTDGRSAIYRSFRLSSVGDHSAAHAIMDSALTSWQEGSEHEMKRETIRKVDGSRAELTALLLQNEKRFAEAIPLWQKRLELAEGKAYPHDLVNVRVEYAACLQAGGKSDEALRQVGLVLQLNPRVGRALYVGAEACLELGRYQESGQLLDRLERSLYRADADHLLLAKAAELRQRLEALARN